MFTRSNVTRFRTRQRSARKLDVEALENRWTPVANVLLSFSNGVLTLTAQATADNEAIRLQMFGPASDRCILVDDPTATTFFNGNGVYTSPTGVPVTAIHINLKSGDDQVDINALQLDGNLDVNVGEGNNRVSIYNGTHLGSVKIAGGAGNDLFGLFNGVVVDHNATLLAGAGGNTVNLEFTVNIGGNLALTAGHDNDQVQLGHLHVAGKTNIALGAGKNSLTNDVSDAAATIFDGAFKATFGVGDDTFNLAHGTKFNSGLTAQLGGGTNTSILQGFDVAGSIHVTGGVGDDEVHLADLQVGGSLTVGLGAGQNLMALDDESEALYADPYNLVVSKVGTEIHGNLKVTSSGIVERIEFGDEQPVHVFGATAITTGAGSALIQIDDTTFDGAVAINTGAGPDYIYIEPKSTQHGFTHFHSTFTVHVGAGMDLLELGDTTTANSTVYFDVKPLFDGGSGKDTLHAYDYDFKGPNTPLGALSW